MKHLGDITKLSGYVVPAVDVVIGGSPCQGLSVAGKQAGLKDERSGLFIEQIRLVKEMRKADAARGKTNDAIRPRYMVWENVPGAFSSNKGRDFEAVLEETVRVAEPKAPPCSCPCERMAHKRLCAIYERDATMASLFDGIGGFPYIWEQLNGKGSCLWASEIEPFPIAVTKYHFGEE